MVAASPIVVGVAGPSAAGKSTLTQELQVRVPLSVVCLDDHYRSKAECPVFDIGSLPWPDGAMPPAFAARGNHDLNVPDAVDWGSALGAAEQAIARAREAELAAVVVEGLLLYGEGTGPASLRALCQRFVLLDVHDTDAGELCRRKWSRPHLGKPSYEQRGVSLAAYRVYWDGYVWPSWKTHSQQVPDGALRLTCTTTTDESVRALLSTGWFD